MTSVFRNQGFDSVEEALRDLDECIPTLLDSYSTMEVADVLTQVIKLH